MLQKKQKIRILVDAHKFDHSFQGTSTYISGLYNALVKYDDLEITLCAENLAALKFHFKDERFHFVKLNSPSKFKRLAFELPAMIKRGNFDYAHFQYIVPIFKDCKFINTIHDLLFLDFKEYFPWTYRVKNKLLFLASAYRSDLVLTVSEYSKLDVVKKFKIPAEKIHVTPNAVTPLEENREEDLNGEVLEVFSNPYLLYVSRFEPRKNHLSLLKAYLNLKLDEQGYDLVFVGSKKEQIEIDAFNLVLTNIPEELKTRVKFRERLSVPALNALYKNAAVFVFPSLAEGFGIPPIEAAIQNCKVLCSNVTAMADFSFFKYRFNPDVQQELETQLMTILKDDNYPYEDIRMQILEKYNWDAIAEDYHKILSERTAVAVPP
jgi:glycosyltransferase involved in cell wall biosynthesis